jgi:hypothetical protein
VRPEGVEPPAYRFEACRSIQLSYGRADWRLDASIAPNPDEVSTRTAVDDAALLRRCVSGSVAGARGLLEAFRKMLADDRDVVPRRLERSRAGRGSAAFRAGGSGYLLKCSAGSELLAA